MEYLYNLNSKSKTVKFFKWAWGVDPTIKYKTMCPYFWAFIGTVIILPVLLLIKFTEFITNPITNYFNTKSEAQASLYIKNLLIELNSKEKSDVEFYNLYKSKCFIDKIDEFYNDNNYKAGMFDDIKGGHNRHLEKLRIKKLKLTKSLDEVKYGIIGKIFLYLIGLTFLTLIVWGIYEILHLFTFNEFIYNLKLFVKVFLCVLALVGFSYLISKGIKNLICNTIIGRVVFWKHIDMLFKSIWFGIRIFFNMIGNLYKQNCPIIHWK
jgi:hypothetical protein